MFEIKPNIHWIGVNDRRTSLFENYWPIPHGVAYNSYLIVDEKIAIIDTVESSKMDDYIDNLLFALNGRKVDGFREVIGAAEGMKEDKSSWISFFQWLRGRGLDRVKLIVGDKCLGMLESVGEVFKISVVFAM